MGSQFLANYATYYKVVRTLVLHLTKPCTKFKVIISNSFALMLDCMPKIVGVT